MGVLTKDDVRQLAAPGNGPRVSLYLPTQPGGPEIGDNTSVRLKNVLREADERLRDAGVEEIDDLLAPARELLREDNFWRNPGAGFAVFLSRDGMRSFRLPLDVKEKVAVGDRFLLKPLLPLLVGDGRFWVLTLSQNRVRLLEGGMDRIREIDLHSIPQRLQDAVGYDFEERSLQFHTGAPNIGPGKSAAMFHGQGVGNDDQKAEVEKFLRAVDRALLELLPDKEAPLVVAAAEPALSIFREITKYPHLADESIEGSPDQKSPEELHRAAWTVVEPGFLKERREAREHFHELSGTGKASVGVEEVVPAVFDGRVDTLFVATDRELWGRYDPESRQLVIEKEPGADRYDLLDVAAAEALQRSARVYAVPAERVPEGGESGLAAIFRY